MASKESFEVFRGITMVTTDEESGEPVIKVGVAQKTESLLQKIPAQIEGYRVMIEETGEFTAQKLPAQGKD